MDDVRAVSLFGCRDPQNLNVSTRFMELLNIHQHNDNNTYIMSCCGSRSA